MAHSGVIFLTPLRGIFNYKGYIQLSIFSFNESPKGGGGIQILDSCVADVHGSAVCDFCTLTWMF